MSERYEIREKIGQGGLGEVFVAYDSRLHREVALKRLSPSEEGTKGNDLSEELLKEAKTLSALQHPNIVTVYDVGTDEKGAFVVMELLKGETLDETVSRGAMTQPDFEEVVTQSLEGLIAAHGSGLVHRDLKPGNIMVNWLASGKFQSKILDFGLAKFGRAPSRQTEDQEEGIFGSIYFMAPEQFEREPLDARTDLYSLGCVYYYALTTNHPFDGETGPLVMASHLQNLVKPLHEARPDLPRWLCDWTMWLINRQMSDRPQTAREALSKFVELRRSAQEPAAGAATPAPPVPTPHAIKPAVAVASQGAVTPQAASRPIRSRPGGTAPVRRIQPAAKSGFPKWAIVTLPLLTIVGIWYVIAKISKSTAEKKEYVRFSELASLEEPDGSSEDVQLLIKYLKKGGNNGTAAALALSKFKNDEADHLFLNAFVEVKGEARSNAVGVAVERDLTEAVPDIIAMATAEPAGTVRDTAISGLSMLAKEKHVDSLLDLMALIEEEKDKRLVADVVFRVCNRLVGYKRTRSVLEALPDMDEATKCAALPLVGRIGGKEALKVLEDNLKDPEDKIQEAAVKGLAAWPTLEPREKLYEIASEDKNPAKQFLALRGYIQMAALNSAVPGAERVNMLKQAMELAHDRREKRIVLGSLANIITPESLAYATELETAGELPTVAERVRKPIEAALAKVVTVSGRTVTVPAEKATITGEYATLSSSTSGGVIESWNDNSTWVHWDLNFETAGNYVVYLNQASSEEAGSSYRVHFAGNIVKKLVKITGSDSAFEKVRIGEFEIPEAGHYRISIEPVSVTGPDLMYLSGAEISSL